MVASRAPKSPEKAMAIILFSILAVVIVLTSLTTSTYSPSSSSSSSSRHVSDPLGLPHFVTHEVRDDPVGSWVHHAWEATEHVVDEVAEEFEEFGEDTARVFEPRETNPRRAGTFGENGRERRGRDGRLEMDDWNVDDEGRAARRREKGGSGARARAEGGTKHHG